MKTSNLIILSILTFIIVFLIFPLKSEATRTAKKDAKYLIWECRTANNELLFNYYNYRRVADEYVFGWTMDGRHI